MLCSLLGRQLGFAKSGGFIGLRKGWQGDWAFGGKDQRLNIVGEQIAEAIFPEGNMDLMKLFLLVAGVFLFPVALSYGVDPAATLPKFMNITVQGTDQTHIFRALMGLYLGMVAFCIIAAFTPEWRRVAVIWAVFFAYSLALGRILSLIVDGMPSPILLFYLVVELMVGTVGLLVLNRERR
jgi:uncharacterized protein DUF4345